MLQKAGNRHEMTHIETDKGNAGKLTGQRAYKFIPQANGKSQSCSPI
ncbi:hypothetical protein [Undibacterium sp. Ji49W]